jgi:hypothetical protein
VGERNVASNPEAAREFEDLVQMPLSSVRPRSSTIVSARGESPAGSIEANRKASKTRRSQCPASHQSGGSEPERAGCRLGSIADSSSLGMRDYHPIVGQRRVSIARFACQSSNLPPEESPGHNGFGLHP